MNFSSINSMPAEKFKEVLKKCCASKQWIKKMMRARPFESEKDFFETADKIWNALTSEDWLEAFAAHPKIGEQTASNALAQKEQSGVQSATPETLQTLATLNKTYFEKFGFIFITCATGKSADEMLNELQKRLTNDEEKEMKIAAEEQRKITRIRLEKL